MTALRLTSFADLAQVRHRFQPKDALELLTAAQPPRRGRVRIRDDVTRRAAPAPQTRTDPFQRHTRVGFVGFILGPSSGFVSAFGTGVLETTSWRQLAWVFHHPSALEQAFHQALGLNSLLYELRILPAIDGVTKAARS